METGEGPSDELSHFDDGAGHVVAGGNGLIWGLVLGHRYLGAGRMDLGYF